MSAWRKAVAAVALGCCAFLTQPVFAAPQVFAISGTFGTPATGDEFGPLAGASFSGTFAIDFSSPDFFGPDRIYNSILASAAQNVPLSLSISTGYSVNTTITLTENAGQIVLGYSLVLGNFVPPGGSAAIFGVTSANLDTPISLTGPTAISFHLVYVPVTFAALASASAGGPIALGGAIQGFALGGDYITASTVAISAVPEPETYVLFFAGLGLIGSIVRRRSRTG